ncbi:AAA family ATPase [Streptomyces sp. NRRL WC-3725]|uniref:AAA family ATPase n=1 Tax=Streptomyces sp. NRRL WC-3725 TaxID=1463933 RepID=UPI0005BCB661|nr:AAA family ATPase [Streptomyces sp. NRRL WC-3725]
MPVSADPAPDPSPAGPPAQEPAARTLVHLIAERLTGSDLDEDTRALLLTAFQDDGGTRGRMPGAYLQSVTVSGFRGIGRTARLPLTPGPGLTLITGRNGSGKSSFAEAVEIALTGDNARWRGRSDIWRKSWRNLHHAQEPQVAVELRIDGDPEPATVLRTWNGDDVADSTAELDRPGHDPVPLPDLGWQEDLATYRPFLSYSELGQVIGGKPSEMYDAVASILGLEQLASADKRLRELARAYETPAKEAKAELPALLALLNGIDDPRARAATSALSGRRPDLARAAELAAGTGPADESLLFDLRRRSTVTGPDTEAVATAVTRLREAIASAEDLRGTSAEDALRRAELLARALAHHRAHPALDTCPVCGGTARLDEEWARDAAEQERLLRVEAEHVLTARRELDSAAQAVRDLAAPPPDWLPSEIAAAWDDWLRCRTVSDPVVLASAAEHAARVTRQEAAARLADQDDTWRDAARALAAWLDKAHSAEQSAPHLARVKAAQKWLKAAHDEIRADRMRPIAEDAQRIWSNLRQQSNVALGPVRLSGSATQRKVALDVTVDDIDAPALGVMSQGELHALALSLFLPRTFLPENPFRFLVIDDPVQSMDPAKVDGLARVLALLAEHRQVIVFTHDTRLPQALKYLRLPATVLTVDRRERSAVRIRSGDDPVKQALNDAKALARTRDLPANVVARVLPGLCRTALEAALLEPARRRLLGSGLPHDDIERRIAKAHKLTELASLALYGETDRVGETMTDLTRAYGQQATDHIRWCNKGAHEAVPVDDAEEIIRRTADLAKAVRSL